MNAGMAIVRIRDVAPLQSGVIWRSVAIWSQQGCASACKAGQSQVARIAAVQRPAMRGQIADRSQDRRQTLETIMFTSLLSALLAQTLYGPTAPPPPPLPSAMAAGEPIEVSPMSSAAVFRANGMTDAGLKALQAIPEPGIARGATRAAQCAVEQLSAQSPLPLGDLAAALRERDATAAAQAAAQTDYLLAALRVLQPSDQRVLLSVLVTGGAILGNAPPPRPQIARPDDNAMPRRGPGGQGGGLAAAGPLGGDRRPDGERRGPPPSVPQASRRGQPCEMMLGG